MARIDGKWERKSDGVNSEGVKGENERVKAKKCGPKKRKSILVILGKNIFNLALSVYL